LRASGSGGTSRSTGVSGIPFGSYDRSNFNNRSSQFKDANFGVSLLANDNLRDRLFSDDICIVPRLDNDLRGKFLDAQFGARGVLDYEFLIGLVDLDFRIAHAPCRL
jgi:hypothetical protein